MSQRARLRRHRTSKRRRSRAADPVGLSLHIVGEAGDLAEEESQTLDEYFRRLEAWERGESPTLREELEQAGHVFPAPETLADLELSGKLWEFVNALADLRVYLQHTDHLSDRELYDRLWEESLTNETIIVPDAPNCASFIDMCGSGSEEDIRLYLSYYAGECERAEWLDFLPEGMPEHEDAAFDRDRFLPSADRDGMISRAAALN